MNFYKAIRGTDMPKISGVWKWNDSLPFQAYNETNNITFISGGQSYTSLSFETGGDPRLETEYSNMKYGDAVVAQGMNGANLSFISSNYQTVDFGSSPQEVSQIFYEVLTENAVQQSTPTTVKAVSSANLAEFKAKCDETYAAVGNIPTVSTELVNLGTLSTSGTLTADQATQIGTTTVGVTARASVNSVTRFYERVNISGTTAMLISADDDALHVLTVNLSTRAYTLSDVPLGGGGDTPDIPTPSASYNNHALSVRRGVYSLSNMLLQGYTVSNPDDTYGGTDAAAIFIRISDTTGRLVTEELDFGSPGISIWDALFVTFTDVTPNSTQYTFKLLDLSTGNIVQANWQSLPVTGLETGKVYLLLSDFDYGGN